LMRSSANGRLQRLSVILVALLTLSLEVVGATGASAAGEDVTCSPGSANAPSTGRVLVEDFQQGDYCQRWTRMDARNGASIRVVRADEASPWLRYSTGRSSALDPETAVSLFTVPVATGAYRSELAFDGSRTVARQYGNYDYMFDMALPSDWQQTDAGVIFMQWHGSNVNGRPTNPPMALSVQGGSYWLIINTLDDQGNVVRGRKQNLGPIAPGFVEQFEVYVHWSSLNDPDDGIVHVLRNWRTAYFHSGPNNYHQNLAPYFKVGIYIPNLNPTSSSASRGAPVPTSDVTLLGLHAEVTRTEGDGAQELSDR
jgi:hypothetical protein